MTNKKTNKKTAKTSNKSPTPARRPRASAGNRICSDCETELNQELFSPGKRICRPCQNVRSSLSLARRSGGGELDMTESLQELQDLFPDNTVNVFDSRDGLAGFIKEGLASAIKAADKSVSDAKQHLLDVTVSKNAKSIDEAEKRLSRAIDRQVNLLTSLSDRLLLMESLKADQVKAPAVTFQLASVEELRELLRPGEQESGN